MKALFVKVLVSFIIMTKLCVYGLCNSNSESPECIAEGVKFIRFPQKNYNLSKCQKWAKLCGRSDFSHKNVNNFTFICSKHFPASAELDFRKNKHLEPFAYPGEVSRTEIQAKPPKTYQRPKRVTVAVPVGVPVPIPAKLEDQIAAQIDNQGNILDL